MVQEEALGGAFPANDMVSVSGSDEESVLTVRGPRGEQEGLGHLLQSGRSPSAGPSTSSPSFSGSERPSRRRESSTRVGGGAAPPGSLQSLLSQLKRSLFRDLNQVAEGLGVHRNRKWLLGTPIFQYSRQATSSFTLPPSLLHFQPLIQRLSMHQVPSVPAPSWRALTGLALVLAFFWWVASDSPPDCSLLPAIHPANACSYSDEELVAILNSPRGFKPGEPRYYFNGRWVDFLTVQFEMEMWKPHPKKKKALLPPCILCSVEGQLPCMQQACIIPLYIRPLTTDIMVLKAHLEDAPQILAPLEVDAAQKHFATVLDGGANIGISTALMAFMYVLATSPAAPGAPSSVMNSSNLRTWWCFFPLKLRYILGGRLLLGTSLVRLDARKCWQLRGSHRLMICFSLLLRFPHARIVAVEASEDNWRMLRLNTLAYPNVIAIHAALWSSLGYSRAFTAHPWH